MRVSVVFLALFFAFATVAQPPATHAPETAQEGIVDFQVPSPESKRITEALAKRVEIFASVWEELKQQGKLVVDTKAFEKAAREQLIKGTGGKIAEKDIALLIQRMKTPLADQFRDQAAAGYFDEYYGRLKIRGFFDLSPDKLPPDLRKLVAYFEKEYRPLCETSC
jgi:hypothetical protein